MPSRQNWSRADIPWVIFIVAAISIVTGRLASGGGIRYGLHAVGLLTLGILDFIGWHINTGGWGIRATGPRLFLQWLGEREARTLYRVLDACLLGASIVLVWL